MSKQVIFLFGQPGAGKGIQAELLSEKLGYYHLESSKVIEACLKKESPTKVFTVDGVDYQVGDEIKNWEAGNLNSPPFVTQLMIEKIRELAKDEKSIIFSGSPRSEYEVKKELPVIKELFGLENIKAFLLEISPETTKFRNSHRRICELIRHSIIFSSETETLTLCPLDGSKLIKRKGLDDPKIIEHRLKIYQEETYPAIKHISSEGVMVHKIKGENSVAQVHGEILTMLKK